VKRWRDGGGFDDERERRLREEAQSSPLVVQSLAPRGGRRGLVLPLAIALVLAMFVLVMAGRYLAYFAPESEPASPSAATPIAWLDATAGPLAPTPTPDPSVTPGAAQTQSPVVRAEIAYQSYLVAPGDSIRFVVELTNTSGRTLALEPCPTYRIYVAGSSALEPDRPLNCAAAPTTFYQGDTLRFEMLYTIPADVSPGDQLLVWETTRYLRANASTSLSVGGAVTPTAG
jgi:hypothetical protein